jgi:acyl-coenzyme A thioesterase PaaI-like protein
VEGTVTDLARRRPDATPPGPTAIRHDPPLAQPFEALFANLEELKFTDPGTLFHRCFGCGPNHEIGLRVRTFRAADGVLSPIIVPKRFEGPLDCAHGGIVATYLDEVLAGAAVCHSGRVHVTGELAVRYLKPTPIERALLGRARAIRETPKYLELQGTLEDLETGEVVATATGRFFPVPDAP